jgi:hypothetical protein
MYDLFISHSSSDKEWVSHLVEALNKTTTNKKFTIWFDEDHILGGDYILKQIEDGIKNSRFIAVVLTPESINSDWVSFERVIFQTMDPMGNHKKVIPILLKDCDIPPGLAALKHLDFRDSKHFDKRLQQLIHALDQHTVEDHGLFKKINAVIGAAKNYNSHTREYSYKLDANQTRQLYALLEEINIANKEEKDMLLKAFLSILHYNDYYLTLTASEYIAALIIKSNAYNWILTELLEQNNWNIKLAAIRSYSKLAEIDEDLVDTSQLIKCILQLDSRTALNRDEETAIGHLVRTIGKINRTPKGQSVIRFLSTKGQVSKEICANIIPFDFANNPPIFLTDLLSDKTKEIKSIPPTDDQVEILHALMNDTNEGVRRAARECWQELKRNWKDLDITCKDPATFTLPAIETGRRVRFAFGAPFSGFIQRVTAQNQNDLKGNVRQGTIVILEGHGILDVFFYDTSGIIIDDGGSLSHRCLRLRNSGTPFASIDPALLKDLPDGTFISVNNDNFEFDTNKSILFR